MPNLKPNNDSAGKSSTKRKSLRFPPDLNAFAYIDTEASSKTFNPEYTALIIEEAYRGANLIMRTNAIFKDNLEIKIKPGTLAIMRAQIRWVKKHSEKVCEIGIEYLE